MSQSDAFRERMNNLQVGECVVSPTKYQVEKLEDCWEVTDLDEFSTNEPERYSFEYSADQLATMILRWS